MTSSMRHRAFDTSSQMQRPDITLSLSIGESVTVSLMETTVHDSEVLLWSSLESEPLRMGRGEFEVLLGYAPVVVNFIMGKRSDLIGSTLHISCRFSIFLRARHLVYIQGEENVLFGGLTHVRQRARLSSWNAYVSRKEDILFYLRRFYRETQEEPDSTR